MANGRIRLGYSERNSSFACSYFSFNWFSARMVRNLPRVWGFGVGRCENNFNHVSQKTVSGVRDSSWALDSTMYNHYTPKVLSLIKNCYFLWCCTYHVVVSRFSYNLWRCLQIHCWSPWMIKNSFLCDSGGMQSLVHAVISVQFNSNAVAVGIFMYSCHRCIDWQYPLYFI